MKAIDLHVHSTCSDGTFTPTQLVDLAIQKGLAAFALTDHDSIDGLDKALSYAAKLSGADTAVPERNPGTAKTITAVPESCQRAAGTSITFSERNPEGCKTDMAIPEAFRRTTKASAAMPERNPGTAKTDMAVPEVVPGIELSTEYHGRDVHILGLYIDHHNASFRTKLREFVDSRTNRNRKMCGLLQAAGMDVTYEKLEKRFPDCTITRAHYGRYLMEQGYVQSINEAFDRYIGDHCPCYVPREKITPAQAIQLILEADGIPILAHPILYHLTDRDLETLVAECKEAGLLGIEALYSTYHPYEERQIRRLAEKYHLLLSGGSDFHGANKPKIELGSGMGRLFVPEELLTEIKKARNNLFFTDMDGTLLNNASLISPAMKDALDRMCAMGHHLILTSGRPLPSILEVQRQLGLGYPNTLIISYNGALVYDCEAHRPLLEYKLSQEDLRYLIQEAAKMQIHVHAYSGTEIICRRWNPELQYYTRRIHLPLKYVEDIADYLPEGSYKLQCIHLTDKKRLEDFRDHIAPYCGDRIQMIFSNDQYLEILPAAAGKGNALRFVEEYLHTPHSHTFAAGDAENDISLLQAAHIGIAMANASPEVKKQADLVTVLDNDHDGLLEILNRFFLT